MIQKVDPKDLRAITYRRDLERLTKLQNELSHKKAEHETAGVRNYEMHLVERKDRLSLEAAQLIGEIDHVPQALSVNTQQLERDIEALTSEIERQKTIVDASGGAFSKALEESNRRKYLKIQKRNLQRVETVAQGYQEEIDFLEALRAAGSRSTSLRPMRSPLVDIMSDPQGAANRYRREVEQFLPEIL